MFHVEQPCLAATMVRRMWIDKPLADATSKIKETADEFRSGLQELTSEVSEEIRDAGELVTLAMVVIGSLAVAALLIACVADAKASRRG